MLGDAFASKKRACYIAHRRKAIGEEKDIKQIKTGKQVMLHRTKKAINQIVEKSN